MRKAVSAIVSLLMIASAPALAVDYIQPFVPNAEMVGEGRLRVFMLDVYDAQLYAPKGDLNNEEPLALRLSYLRDIPGKKIADRSLDEMRDQDRWSAEQLEAWHEKMLNVFPDVKKGDELTGVLTKNNQTVFLMGGQEIARIEDSNFGTAFFNIWLSEKTGAPTLRKKLLGQLAEAQR